MSRYVELASLRLAGVNAPLTLVLTVALMASCHMCQKNKSRDEIVMSCDCGMFFCRTCFESEFESEDFSVSPKAVFCPFCKEWCHCASCKRDNGYDDNDAEKDVDSIQKFVDDCTLFPMRAESSENKLYLAKFKGCSYDEENLYLFELDTDSAVNTQWLKFIKRYNKRRALIRSGKLTGGPVVKQWWIKNGHSSESDEATESADAPDLQVNSSQPKPEPKSSHVAPLAVPRPAAQVTKVVDADMPDAMTVKSFAFAPARVNPPQAADISEQPAVEQNEEDEAEGCSDSESDEQMQDNQFDAPEPAREPEPVREPTPPPTPLQLYHRALRQSVPAVRPGSRLFELLSLTELDEPVSVDQVFDSGLLEVVNTFATDSSNIHMITQQAELVAPVSSNPVAAALSINAKSTASLSAHEAGRLTATVGKHTLLAFHTAEKLVDLRARAVDARLRSGLQEVAVEAQLDALDSTNAARLAQQDAHISDLQQQRTTAQQKAQSLAAEIARLQAELLATNQHVASLSEQHKQAEQQRVHILESRSDVEKQLEAQRVNASVFHARSQNVSQQVEGMTQNAYQALIAAPARLLQAASERVSHLASQAKFRRKVVLLCQSEEGGEEDRSFQDAIVSLIECVRDLIYLRDSLRATVKSLSESTVDISPPKLPHTVAEVPKASHIQAAHASLCESLTSASAELSQARKAALALAHDLEAKCSQLVTELEPVIAPYSSDGLLVLHHPVFEQHRASDPTHPENPKRMQYILKALRAQEQYSRKVDQSSPFCVFAESAREATEAELCMAHNAPYVVSTLTSLRELEERGEQWEKRQRERLAAEQQAADARAAFSLAGPMQPMSASAALPAIVPPVGDLLSSVGDVDMEETQPIDDPLQLLGAGLSEPLPAITAVLADEQAELEAEKAAKAERKRLRRELRQQQERASDDDFQEGDQLNDDDYDSDSDDEDFDDDEDDGDADPEPMLMIDCDTFASPQTRRAALQAVGTVLDAVELVLQGKYSTTFSVIRPPGHHAGRDGNAMDAPSQGFCLFNNAAVGALKAKQLMDARVTSVQSPSARSQAISNAVAAGHRILVYDFDVHHGNGTEDIFRDYTEIAFISTHIYARGFYPNSGRVGVSPNILDIPLPLNFTPELYLHLFDSKIVPFIRDFKPDLIIFSAGFDARHGDDVGGSAVAPEDTIVFPLPCEAAEGAVPISQAELIARSRPVHEVPVVRKEQVPTESPAHPPVQGGSFLMPGSEFESLATASIVAPPPPTEEIVDNVMHDLQHDDVVAVLPSPAPVTIDFSSTVMSDAEAEQFAAHLQVARAFVAPSSDDARAKLNALLSVILQAALALDASIGGWFKIRVNAVEHAGYAAVVSRPMDLGTIKSRIESNHYVSAAEFADDAVRIARASCDFNGPEHFVTLEARKITKILQVLLRERADELRSVGAIEVSEQRKSHDVLAGALEAVGSHARAAAFRYPVPRTLEGYYDAIVAPTDLYSIAARVAAYKIRNKVELMKEVDRMRRNAEKFWGAENPIALDGRWVMDSIDAEVERRLNPSAAVPEPIPEPVVQAPIAAAPISSPAHTEASRPRRAAAVRAEDSIRLQTDVIAAETQSKKRHVEDDSAERSAKQPRIEGSAEANESNSESSGADDQFDSDDDEDDGDFEPEEDEEEGFVGLRPEDYYYISHEVGKLAREFCHGRVVSVLEGGYGETNIGACVIQHLLGVRDGVNWVGM